MKALTSELAKDTRHPPPGEGSPADTPDVPVQGDRGLPDRGGETPPITSIMLFTAKGELAYNLKNSKSSRCDHSNESSMVLFVLLLKKVHFLANET